MITVRIKANGDVWVDQQSVIDQLQTVTHKDLVCFDTGAEGISLTHSGVLKFINQWIKDTGHPPEQVVLNTPNLYEKTQYVNVNTADNHFLQLSGHYYTDVPDIDASATKFGFFVGRYTAERNQIARDIVSCYQPDFVMSVMKTAYNPSPWHESVQNIPSIDDLSVRDQYIGQVDTNLSLLRFYNQFQIELIAETMCAGITFFPTEKTFRPITGLRPFLLYGSVNFLNNLRGLGFRTYSECWDETYDQYQGPERWNRIKTVIEQIIQQGYDVELANKIAHYNRQHLTRWHKNTMPKDMPRVIA
ncbi:hypothetical protein UFOVP328_413 [uncultured Caudovirales phage]|uniref:Uncharacterized protein n=1 Tax=uncultured Caudovirales phage TaxID=2100421 RepID=A0A6J5LZP7_9CAUD|nr:hypothetical protein UFOVP328_413 [uncultured Caudovirales phage]